MVGYYKFFPYENIIHLKQIIEYKTKKTSDSSLEGKLTLDESFQKYAFTKKASLGNLIYKPLLTVDDLYSFNQNILVQSNWYKGSYDKIKIISIEEIFKNTDTPILKINYQIYNKNFSAYAYGKSLDCSKDNGATALIIPGSGNNQSEAIIKNDIDNYHYGVLGSLKSIPNIFVQIKPNRDARAWHNGDGRRVHGDFIYNWQISMGGSYSVSYLIEAIAIIKYMKQCSKKNLVIGLSQGGLASLYAALESDPSVAIVASGFSLFMEKIKWSGFNDFLGLPYDQSIISNNDLTNAIKKSKSKFIFTWGLNESLYYREDAKIAYTASFLKNLENVSWIIHSEGHTYPIGEIKNLIPKEIGE